MADQPLARGSRTPSTTGSAVDDRRSSGGKSGDRVSETSRSNGRALPVKKDLPPSKRPATTSRVSAPLAITTSMAKSNTTATPRPSPGTGFSKPPTRPTTGSTVSRPPMVARASTAAIPGHRSQPSVSSTTKAKIPLAGAARRGSLAPSSVTRTPISKTTSLAADRRATIAPVSNAVKRPTVTSSTSAKRVAPSSTTSSSAKTPSSNDTTSASTAVRPTANSKKPVSTVSSTIKKRLSTIPGSPSVQFKTPGRPVATPDMSSQEVDALRKRVKQLEAEVQTLRERKQSLTEGKSRSGSETSSEKAKGTELTRLKADLKEREKKISILQEQFKSLQSKAAGATKTVPEDSGAKKSSEDSLREEHSRALEEAQSAHKRELEALQASHQERLDRDGKDSQELHGRLQNQEGAMSDSTTQISALGFEVDNLKAALANAESAMLESASQHKAILKDRDHEIMGMTQVIEKLQDELQKQHEVKERDFVAKVDGLGEQHQTYVHNLEEEHKAAMAQLINEHAASLGRNSDEAASYRLEKEKELTQLAEGHHVSMNVLQEQLDDVLVARKELEGSMDSLKVAHETAMQVEKEKFERSEAELREADSLSAQKIRDAQEEAARTIMVLEEKIDKREAQFVEAGEARAKAEATLEKVKLEVKGLEKALETISSESKGTDEQHAAMVAGLNDQLDRQVAALTEKDEEISLVKQQHESALKSLTDAHNEKIGMLEAEAEQKWKTRFEELHAKHEELSKTIKDNENYHAQALGSLKRDHAKEVDEKLKSLTSSQKVHDEELERFKEEAADKLAELRGQLEGSHNEEKSKTAMAHASAVKGLQEELTKQSKALAIATQNLEAAKKAASVASNEKRYEAELQVTKQDLEKEKAAIVSLWEELKSVKFEHSDAVAHQAALRAEVEELHTKLARDKATISELTSHLEDAKSMNPASSEMQRLKEDMKHLVMQHAEEIAKIQGAGGNEPSSANIGRTKKGKNHAQLQKALKDAATHEANYQKALNEIKEHKASLAKANEAATRDMDDLNVVLTRQIEAAQKEADETNQRNKFLNEELKKVKENADESTTRVREAEAKLEATLAALQEAETKASLVDAAAAEPQLEGVEGEGDGSSIQGTLAGIKTQLAQLEDVNEDLKDEASRMVKIMSRVGRVGVSEIAV